MDHNDHGQTSLANYGKRNEYRTIIKERQERQQGQTLLQTPSPMRRYLYRPSNFQLIFQHQTKLISESHSKQGLTQSLFNKNGQGSTTYIILAKIQSIKNEHNRYYFTLSDQTTPTSNLVIYYSKGSHQSTLSNFVKNTKLNDEESVDEIQYESNKEGGHPYFKFWLRLAIQKKREGEAELGWTIEKIERIKDYNELIYHNLSVILDHAHFPYDS